MELEKAKKLAGQLINKYAAKDFSFGGFIKDRHLHGCCNYHDKKIYLQERSTKESPEEHVRFVILHEIVHTLYPVNGHDRTFVLALEALLRIDYKHIKGGTENASNKTKMPTMRKAD